MKRKRIVITGMGIVSPIGSGIGEFWDGLSNGKSGIEISSLFNEDKFSNRLYGIVKDFNFTPYTGHKAPIGRSSAFGIEATREALRQAELSENDNPVFDATGVSIGSLLGEIGLREEVWMKHGWDPDLKREFTFFSVPLITQNIARWFKFKGPNSTVSTACSSAVYAIIEACEILRNDQASIMVVGGVESISFSGHGNFIRINALDPEKIRPFDGKRRGTLISEGAGILVLETLESALNRGVSILGEIKGIGMSCDGHHESAPDPTCHQIINAMRRAVDDACLDLKDIECISAHGTGTIPNDKYETKAIKELFGNIVQDISITANKSMLGHGIGSACAESVIGAVLMIENNLVVPTINFENPDPECDLDYTFNKARSRELNNVMVNSYGFGGNNGSVIVSRFCD